MTNRQVETSREIRLWITGILGPVLMAGATILANNPEVQGRVWEKTKATAETIKSKLTFKKKEDEA